MRGTPLIFHSLDPIDLDRIDDLSFDLDSLPYIEDEIDKYSFNDSQSYNTNTNKNRMRTSSSSSSDDSLLFNTTATRAPTTTANNVISNTTESKRKSEPNTTSQSPPLEQRDNNVNNVALANPFDSTKKTFGRNNISNFSILSQDLPLNKSNYQDPVIPSSKSQHQVREGSRDGAVINKMNGVFQSNQRNMSQLNGNDDQTRAMKETAFASLVGSRLPLSRLSETRSAGIPTNEISIGKDKTGHHHSNHNFKGFARFLFGPKEDKNRFDIYNLSPQLKEELRRIYVY